MAQLELHLLRGDLVESRHRVDVVVVDPSGRTVATTGVDDHPVFWRSTAKPFQLWPLVEAGGVERFHLDSRHLALACASHNAEPMHREVATEWLAHVGIVEGDLSCGGHLSLSAAVAESMIRDGVTATPLWSNCSGKHAALLALARLHGWPLAGYQQVGHPVQEAVAQAIATWTGVDRTALRWGVDGCTAAAVATPLARLALAWARLGATPDRSMSRIRDAMLAHPQLVAGTGRLDTVLMESWPGRVLAKVGAEGVFAATLPTLGLGVALKVEDGSMSAAGQALVAVLMAVTSRLGADDAWPTDRLQPWLAPVVRNTRNDVTGRIVLDGTLPFS